MPSNHVNAWEEAKDARDDEAPTVTMRKRSAFDVCQDLLCAAESAEDGEVTPDLEEHFKALGVELATKISGYSAYKAMERARAKAHREQAEMHLKAAKRIDERVADRMAYLEAALTMGGTQPLDKLKGATGGSVYYTNTAHVEVDEDMVPLLDEEYLRIPAPEVDKKKLLAMHREGKPLPMGIEVRTLRSFVLR